MPPIVKEEAGKHIPSDGKKLAKCLLSAKAAAPCGKLPAKGLNKLWLHHDYGPVMEGYAAVWRWRVSSEGPMESPFFCHHGVYFTMSTRSTGVSGEPKGMSFYLSCSPLMQPLDMLPAGGNWNVFVRFCVSFVAQKTGSTVPESRVYCEHVYQETDVCPAYGCLGFSMAPPELAVDAEGNSVLELALLVGDEWKAAVPALVDQGLKDTGVAGPVSPHHTAFTLQIAFALTPIREAVRLLWDEGRAKVPKLHSGLLEGVANYFRALENGIQAPLPGIRNLEPGQRLLDLFMTLKRVAAVDDNHASSKFLCHEMQSFTMLCQEDYEMQMDEVEMCFQKEGPPEILLISFITHSKNYDQTHGTQAKTQRKICGKRYALMGLLSVTSPTTPHCFFRLNDGLWRKQTTACPVPLLVDESEVILSFGTKPRVGEWWERHCFTPLIAVYVKEEIFDEVVAAPMPWPRPVKPPPDPRPVIIARVCTYADLILNEVNPNLPIFTFPTNPRCVKMKAGVTMSEFRSSVSSAAGLPQSADFRLWRFRTRRNHTRRPQQYLPRTAQTLAEVVGNVACLDVLLEESTSDSFHDPALLRALETGGKHEPVLMLFLRFYDPAAGLLRFGGQIYLPSNSSRSATLLALEGKVKELLDLPKRQKLSFTEEVSPGKIEDIAGKRGKSGPQGVDLVTGDVVTVSEIVEASPRYEPPATVSFRVHKSDFDFGTPVEVDPGASFQQILRKICTSVLPGADPDRVLLYPYTGCDNLVDRANLCVLPEIFDDLPHEEHVSRLAAEGTAFVACVLVRPVSGLTAQHLRPVHVELSYMPMIGYKMPLAGLRTVQIFLAEPSWTLVELVEELFKTMTHQTLEPGFKLLVHSGGFVEEVLSPSRDTGTTVQQALDAELKLNLCCPISLDVCVECGCCHRCRWRTLPCMLANLKPGTSSTLQFRPDPFLVVIPHTRLTVGELRGTINACHRGTVYWMDPQKDVWDLSLVVIREDKAIQTLRRITDRKSSVGLHITELESSYPGASIAVVVLLK